MGDQVAIDERIRELVDAHRPELEKLVDQALAAELAQLVEQRLAARNGAEAVSRSRESDSNGARQAVAPAPAGMKTCRVCGEQKPAGEYESRRGTCRSCRRAQLRERAARQGPAGAEPRPSIAVDELLHRVKGHGAVAPDLEPWLIAEQLAVRVDGGLAPTGRGVELGGGLA